jgi:CRISPR-associated protein Csb1
MESLSDTTIDVWADDLRGPVALHLRETLKPVEGEGSVVFPPTYAAGERREGPPYAIDELRDGTKVVQIDSVGSQANRIEPLFVRGRTGTAENPLAELVPQIFFKIEGDYRVSLLEVGHRLGDALVRSSTLKEDAAAAFSAFLEHGDAGPIAKLAPTSLVFGAWDSRGEGAKLPRLVQSVIRAWNVEPLRRSAQYIPAIDYAKFAVFSDEEKEKAEGNPKSPLAERGFVHVPAVDTHGGVVVRGGIYRDVTVNLVALRHLGAAEKATELRRYILGLALVAATEPQDGFLRQGCLVTPDPEASKAWTLVHRSGRREELLLNGDVAFEYAKRAAVAFGVGADREDEFLRDRAKADLPKKDAKAKKSS